MKGYDDSSDLRPGTYCLVVRPSDGQERKYFERWGQREMVVRVVQRVPLWKILRFVKEACEDLNVGWFMRRRTLRFVESLGDWYGVVEPFDALPRRWLMPLDGYEPQADEREVRTKSPEEA